MPFDFVIGSSHIVHGYDPYYKEYFKGREESACYREYFESILENLHAFSEMDVYGHIDYIVVKPNGSVEVFNIKSSHESPAFWD